MSKKIELTIDKIVLKKSGLTTIQYLLLAYLKHDTNIVFKQYDMKILESLEELDYIRIVEDQILINPKTNKLIEGVTLKQVDEVILHFNDLKNKELKISRISKCKTDRSSINARIKEFGLQAVKDVITLKFNLWKNDYAMKKYLTSMTTLIKNTNFEGYVNQLELHKNNEIIKQSKLV